MMKKLHSQQGFTILELMIASMIFSVILLLCAFGLLRIGRTYYHGVISSRTQSVARTASDHIVEAIQYGRGNISDTAFPVTSGTSYSVSVGPKTYQYVLGRKFTDSSSPAGDETTVGLKEITYAEDGITPLSTKQLLGKGMWITTFVIKYDTTASAYKVWIKVGSGDLDLIEDKDKKDFLTDTTFDLDSAKCKLGPGSQYCATGELYTMTYKRL